MSIENTEIDRQHCLAIVHEYHRCRDSFDLFCSIAEAIILQDQTREKSYRAYNAYASFIIHLYEFLISLHARDLGLTEIKNKGGRQKYEILDSLIQSTANKVVKNRIYMIEKGLAPKFENDIEFYKKLLPIPDDFSKQFRQTRNKISGHVTYERIKKIDLTKFYETNHTYLYLMYRDCGDFWSNRSNEFPELELVTDFLKSIAQNCRHSGNIG